MRKKMKKTSRIWFFMAFVMILSGGITYRLIFNSQTAKNKIADLPLEASIAGGKSADNAKGIDLEEMLKDGKNLFVESYNGSNDMIELSEEEGKEITGILKALELERIDLSDKDESYDYILHVKTDNIKIKIGSPFIFIEGMSGNRVTFQGKESDIKELELSIEGIYMKKYQKSDLFANPESISVVAEDEGYRWDVEKADMDMFMNQISLISPMGEGEAAFAVAEYPDYRIQIKTSQQVYDVHLINKELLTIDTQNQYAYYQYDNKLWNFITKKYPVELKAKSGELKSLLGANKITVDDHKDAYDLEDDSYYHRAIARTILRGKPKEVADMEQQLPLIFTLTFEIGNGNKVVYVYNDYLSFEGKHYHIPRIDEAIRGTLGVY